MDTVFKNGFGMVISSSEKIYVQHSLEKYKIKGVIDVSKDIASILSSLLISNDNVLESEEKKNMIKVFAWHLSEQNPFTKIPLFNVSNGTIEKAEIAKYLHDLTRDELINIFGEGLGEMIKNQFPISDKCPMILDNSIYKNYEDVASKIIEYINGFSNDEGNLNLFSELKFNDFIEKNENILETIKTLFNSQNPAACTSFFDNIEDKKMLNFIETFYESLFKESVCYNPNNKNYFFAGNRINGINEIYKLKKYIIKFGNISNNVGYDTKIVVQKKDLIEYLDNQFFKDNTIQVPENILKPSETEDLLKTLNELFGSLREFLEQFFDKLKKILEFKKPAGILFSILLLLFIGCFISIVFFNNNKNTNKQSF